MSDRVLAPGEWAVLALLCERPTHGWALASQLSVRGELGSIWSLTRPLVYRSLEILEQRGLIESAGSERGDRGPHRTIFRATETGTASVGVWLAEPVEHIRDGRSLLLLKLVFARRNGVDPEPMLAAQRETLNETLHALEARADDSDTVADGILLRFRIESTRGVLRFLDAMLEDESPHGAESDGLRGAGPKPAA